MIDIHAHILPGIDDGARTLEDSVELVRELASTGVTDIIATPHYMHETIYTSSQAENARLAEKLRRELTNAEIDVRIHLGNEVYIIDKIAELIADGRIATLAKSEYLLVELPMSGEFLGAEDILQDLILHGYKVILAHPERYATVQNDFEVVQKIYEMGVLLQCNLGSVVGKYGKHAHKIMRKLAKKDMIFAFGSDIHHCQGEEYWAEVQKKLRKYYKGDKIDQVLVRNPMQIVGV